MGPVTCESQYYHMTSEFPYGLGKWEGNVNTTSKEQSHSSRTPIAAVKIKHANHYTIGPWARGPVGSCLLDETKI